MLSRCTLGAWTRLYTESDHKRSSPFSTPKKLKGNSSLYALCVVRVCNMRVHLQQEITCGSCKWLVRASVLFISPALLPLVLLLSVAGLMLLFPLGCAIIGLLSWQKLRPLATREEQRGKLLHSGLVNSGLLKSIISLLCISQLGKFVKWAEKKIPRGANPDRRNSGDTDSVEAVECDNDNNLDVLFWFNPLANIFADETCVNVDGISASSWSGADDDEESQGADEFAGIDKWVCDGEMLGSLETSSSLRICKEFDHMVDTTVRGYIGFRDQWVRESDQSVDVSPSSMLWYDIPGTEKGIAAIVESKSSNITAPTHKFQRRSCAIRVPHAVSNEPTSDKTAYTFGSNIVDFGSQNSSTGAINTGVRFHGVEEDTQGRKVEAESMDRNRAGYSDAQHYYSRNKRKQKGKACVEEDETCKRDDSEAQAASDDEINKSLPYMWELEAVWRRVSDGRLRRRQPDSGGSHHQHAQFSELLDFWRHVEQVSPQHTYTPPTSAPVSPSNSTSSCSSPH